MQSDMVILDEDDLPSARLWRVYTLTPEGDFLDGDLSFTFDKETVLNLFSDFPEKFTDEQIQILKEEEPYWYDFFSDRLK